MSCLEYPSSSFRQSHCVPHCHKIVGRDRGVMAQRHLVVSLDNVGESAQLERLNSPHSLEACRVCGVDPSELTPRPLSAFLACCGATELDRIVAERRCVHTEKRRLATLHTLQQIRKMMLLREQAGPDRERERHKSPRNRGPSTPQRRSPSTSERLHESERLKHKMALDQFQEECRYRQLEAAEKRHEAAAVRRMERLATVSPRRGGVDSLSEARSRGLQLQQFVDAKRQQDLSLLEKKLALAEERKLRRSSSAASSTARREQERQQEVAARRSAIGSILGQAAKQRVVASQQGIDRSREILTSYRANAEECAQYNNSRRSEVRERRAQIEECRLSLLLQSAERSRSRSATQCRSARARSVDSSPQRTAEVRQRAAALEEYRNTLAQQRLENQERIVAEKRAAAAKGRRLAVEAAREKEEDRAVEVTRARRAMAYALAMRNNDVIQTQCPRAHVRAYDLSNVSI